MLSVASLTVKPLLLSLFETYVVTLPPKVWRPALKAILLSLLPALEDPASEEFERTHDLLNLFRKSLVNGSSSGDGRAEERDDRLFWQSLFIATISSASRRPGALAYLERNLPLLGTETWKPDASTARPNHFPTGVGEKGSSFHSIITPEPGLLVRCFAAGLQDDHVLIQRGFLELLVTHLPLNSMVLNLHVTPQDRELLINAATSVVVRREVSLNRRLWIWFLGQAPSSEADHSGTASPQSDVSTNKTLTDALMPVQYFEQYGSAALASGILQQFHSRSVQSSLRARPFRICLSLMDRWEIGGIILPQVFRPAMQSVYQYKMNSPSVDAFAEVHKSACSFFDAVESKLIWKSICNIVLAAFNDTSGGKLSVQGSDVVTQLELVHFIITSFNIREEDMLMVHIPIMMVLLLCYACETVERLESEATEESQPDILGHLLKSVVFLLEQLPDRFQLQSRAPDGDKAIKFGNIAKPSNFVRQFYDDAGAEDDVPARHVLIDSLFDLSFDLISATLKTTGSAAHLGNTLSFALRLVNRMSSSLGTQAQSVLSHLAIAAHRLPHSSEGHFLRQINLISTLELLYATLPRAQWQADRTIRQVIRTLLQNLWFHISSSNPCHNSEATRGIWRLHELCPEPGTVEAAVTDFLYQSKVEENAKKLDSQAVRRFIVFWTHSMTMFRSLLARRASLVQASQAIDAQPEKLLHDPQTIARPLFLVLDTLRQAHDSSHLIVDGWLRVAPDVNM